VHAPQPGTATGVTLGLGVSAGGLFMPLPGLVADHHGPRGAFIVLTVIPAIAIAVSTVLREPAHDHPPVATTQLK
jgi:FSR family fosmidomycin resistance protein-like MFS transporter